MPIRIYDHSKEILLHLFYRLISFGAFSIVGIDETRYKYGELDR